MITEEEFLHGPPRDFEEKEQWVNCYKTVGGYTGLPRLGHIVSYSLVWRGTYDHPSGLYWLVEFKSTFLWIFRTTERVSYHSKDVRFLPVLEQLARSGE